MKIVRIIGGLGNQMFQYSLFKCLKKKNVDVYLDIKDMDSYSLHNGLELESVFGIRIQEDLSSESNIAKLKDERILLKMRKYIGQVVFSSPGKLIKQSHFSPSNYSSLHLEIFDSSDKYLDGYWQNDNYFAEIRASILDLYKFHNISESNIALANKMRLEDSVSIHVRRYDRIKGCRKLGYQFRLRLFTRICNKDYYNKAISYIDSQIENPVYYVFSNDISWVKKNLHIDKEVVYVNWNYASDSYQDMFLMSQSKHNIISLSTFSWWSAWLNKNATKIIIAPAKGILRFSKVNNIIPEAWKMI